MPANAPAAVANSTASRRRWWQFSLLNLLLVAVIVCVTAAYYGERQQLEQANRKIQSQQSEIEDLRKQFGILAVTDESKIYLEARPRVSPHEPLYWHWRIYLPKLPPGSTWLFEQRVGTVGPTGIERPTGGSIGTIHDGQFDLEITISRHLDGSAWLYLNANRNGRGFSNGNRLSEEDVQSLRRLVTQRGAQSAGRKLLVASPDERLELLRIASSDKAGEQTGLIISLEKKSESKSPTNP